MFVDNRFSCIIQNDFVNYPKYQIVTETLIIFDKFNTNTLLPTGVGVCTRSPPPRAHHTEHYFFFFLDWKQFNENFKLNNNKLYFCDAHVLIA